MTITMQGNFKRIFSTSTANSSNSQVFVSAQNLPKIILHSSCHSSGPVKATKDPEVPFKDNGPSDI